jgi:hypothetical protein
MVTGSLPWEGVQNFSGGSKNKVREQLSRYLEDQVLVEAILAMMEPNPNKRPTVHELLTQMVNKVEEGMEEDVEEDVEEEGRKKERINRKNREKEWFLLGMKPMFVEGLKREKREEEIMRRYEEGKKRREEEIRRKREKEERIRREEERRRKEEEMRRKEKEERRRKKEKEMLERLSELNTQIDKEDGGKNSEGKNSGSDYCTIL